MKNKPKVVIDTNIFINGWFFDNDSAIKVLNLIDKRKLQLLFGQDTIGELFYVTKNFARKHIKETRDVIKFLNGIIPLFYYSTSVNTMEVKCPTTKDKYDNMFIRCAVQGKADYLVTDDFKSGMHKIKGLDFKVLSSRDFVKFII